MFKERLRNTRREKNINQSVLAEKTGVEPNTISRYERGERMPPSDVLLKIADVLECTTDYLLGRTDEPNFVEFKTETPDGDKIVIELDKEYYEGLTKEKIERLIEMGRAWQEASDKIKKKPSKD